MFAAIQLTASLLSAKPVWNTSNFWITGSFFLYAVHFLYSPSLMAWLGGMLQPATPAAHLGFYLLLCLIVIGLAIGAYAILYRQLPSVASTLVGGRIRR